jgi:glycosyltransferase involved in cell wall biosynthesis
MFATADVVLATSQSLLKTASAHTERAFLLTSGVRYQDFQRARHGTGEPPAPLRALRTPIVGFIGSIRNELDLTLLREVALLLPDLTFVFVGPVVADITLLAACPNVRMVGPVPHADVVRYTVRFDVGLLPYVVNAYTEALKPVKLKEYLAAGLPIVSTGLPEVRRFVDEHGPVVTFAGTPDAFARAIRSALSGDNATLVAKRLDIARRHDWAIQLKTMSAIVEAALERNRDFAQLTWGAAS